MREPVWGGPGLRRLPERRIRKARFKQRDLRVLVDSVMERRRDIFGQGGRPPSLQSRRRAWIFVMERVNAVSGTRRSWEEVRKKVHDLKKSTKEKLAYNRRSRQLSGGGRPVVKALTEFENDMLALFGKETFEGFDPGDLAVTSQLSDQGETSGSSTIAANRRCTPEFQISSAHPEAGTSTGTPTAGDGSAEDEEALGESLDVGEEGAGPILVEEDERSSSFEDWRPTVLGSPMEADADTDLSGPAFKRRLLEHEFSVEQRLASIHTTVEDGMVMLDQRLSALQSAIVQLSMPVASAVETSLTQALETVGTSLVNAHTSAIEALGSKLQEAIKAGFVSLGESLQETMAEGFQSFIEAQCSVLTQVMGQHDKMASSSGSTQSRPAGGHSGKGSLSTKHPPQAAGGAAPDRLESKAAQHQRPLALMQVHQG